jgi:hypothetical protein
MEQKQPPYRGPERRRSQAPYQGEERRQAAPAISEETTASRDHGNVVRSQDGKYDDTH